MSPRLKRMVVAMSLTALVAVPGAALAAPVAHAGTVAAGAPAPAEVIGDAPGTAAASCFEVKQLRPSAPDGVYWLYTSRLTQPMQFFCDQTTDGGGWVLVGKGRETWKQDHSGQNGVAADGNTTAAIRTPGPGSSLNVAVQLDVPTVDGLLDGAPVSSLSSGNSGDGVRLRRALDSDGLLWQEVRTRYRSMSGWSWSILGAEHPLSGSTIGGLSFSNGTNTNYGTSQLHNRVTTTGGSGRGWRYGFRYGSMVTGQNNSTTHLWAPTNGGGNAAPYTQVYLRPRVLSSSFQAVGDSGTPAREKPRSLRDTADVMPWGVSGTRGSTSSEFNKEVQAFAEADGVMYVGGNFRYVQRDNGGTGRVEQSFLAAFDKSTGEWISSFRPQLNEQVHSLAVLPDGTVVAGGAFSQANGRAETALVALDPVSGATRPDWNVRVENRVTGSPLRIMTLDYRDGHLYLGGGLTHLAGGSAPTTYRYAKNAARISVPGYTPSNGWNPDFNGTVFDLSPSASASKLYSAGFFTTAVGETATNAAVVSTGTTATLLSSGWNPVWAAPKSYQMTIVEGDANRFYSGGSEHLVFGFDQTTYARTSGTISKSFGGDTQSSDRSDDGLLFFGSHANEFIYNNAFSWPNLTSGWNRADNVKWLGVWDASTGDYVPDFSPTLNMRAGSGIWAVEVDSTGKVWAGGDVTSVGTPNGVRWSGGFARFPRSDSTAPGAPGNLRRTASTASTVTLGWNAAPGGPARYQVLRDDRVVAVTNGTQTSLVVPRGDSGRFFVRAVDAAGNVGASTSVLNLDDLPVNQAPSATFTSGVEGLTVSLDAAGSTDPDGSIVSYEWDFGDGSTGSGSTASHTYTAAGDHTVRLTVTDDAGATGVTQRTVRVAEPSTVTTEVVSLGSEWKWRYEADAPAADWRSDPQRSAGWSSGVGTLGWGTTPLGTKIDDAFPTTSSRPLTAYFTQRVEIDDASRVTELVLDSWADDGAVFYVNGTEVARRNMPTGTVGHGTYAVAARQTAAAKADPVRVSVPVGLLRDGVNLVAVETHLNFRGTPNVSFDMSITKTVENRPANLTPTAVFDADSADLVARFDASGSTDPDGSIVSYEWDFGDGTTGSGVTASHAYAAPGVWTVTLTVTDAGGKTASASLPVTVGSLPTVTEVVSLGSEWKWRYEADAPAADWRSDPQRSAGWSSGVGTLGWGTTPLGTKIDDAFPTTSSRPLTAYFTQRVEIEDASRVTELVLDSWADDGAVFYVNGTEVARRNMPTGTVGHGTYAVAARQTAAAKADPVRVSVPVGLLRDGVNLVAVETHLNFRGTPNVSFDMVATLTTNE
ncbi:PKD domain-containing protein [Nocardioides jishulii]|uniref:PKD domain-containing protein n=1 Tax=Nocardioides jishulii TaxID=2575440 RepID=UPI00110DF5A2|nr:PKD domain-containing protein [Nocardioides jishulii]QCX26649.1 PKD domain-containing protein [Nocardioides jishulii]